MGCPDANQIAAFVDGSLDPARAEQLARHLEQCAACDERVGWSKRVAQTTPASGAPGAGDDRPGRPREALLGRYVQLDLLGAGGMGAVYAAYDPRLDRKIALKLLWDEDDAARASLEREARLAARLQHPNAIAVYDVGAVGKRVFLAMEYVDGVTLAAWIRTARPAREVLGVFLQAARGLAAAHAAGLVHRDFKPSNALVGRDGRVRVLDFGLARAVDDPPASDAGDAGTAGPPARGDSSATGARAGSPAYMAPEQHRGERAGAAADQFAFCVALYEALYGVRPFPGDAPDELTARVLAGHVAEPPRGARVPPWLRGVLLRGLSLAPAARFPSMDALIAALARDPTRARRARIAIAAVAGAAALGLAAHAHAVHDRAAACSVRDQRVRVLVDPVAARRVRTAFLATGASFAAASADRALDALDRYARELGGRARDVCLADGPEPGLRAGCLDELAAELGGTVDAFAGADRTVVALAISATSQLRPVATCDEDGAAARGGGAAAELALRVARARALYHAGRFAAATDEATRAAGDARTAGDRRAELAALLVLGQLEIQHSKPTAATTLSRTVELGEALGRDADVEIALEQLAFHATQRSHDFAAAHHYQRLAAAKLARTGRTGGRLGDVTVLDGTILFTEGRLTEAEGALREGLALQEAAYGADNPILATTLDRLAAALTGQGREADALPLNERAAAIRDRTFGPEHPRLVAGLVALADSLSAAGRNDEARARLIRADAIARTAFGPDSAERFYTLDDLGFVERRRGDYDAAETALQTALAITGRRMGEDSGEAATVLADLGEVYTSRGEPDRGLAFYQRALPLMEHAYGAEHRAVGDLLAGLGRTYLALHRAGDAVPVLERALRLRSGETPGRAAPLRFALARALWDAGRDRPRAVALARQAAGIPIRPGEGVTEAEISAWLAAHAPR
ncbi:MAG TPA: tetratricopeptide repeat protein [Kofleriaceae bacterium]|nr:tetratricopeptide repeat protein [Kofleriaceae bacterium]